MKAAVTVTVSTAIMAAVTAALGIAIFGIATGWANIASLQFSEEVGEGVAQIRADLLIEHVHVSSGKVNIWLRNIGGVELAIEVVSGSSSPSFSSPIILGIGEATNTSIPFSNPITIYYIPTPLIDPDSGVKMEYVEKIVLELGVQNCECEGVGP